MAALMKKGLEHFGIGGRIDHFVGMLRPGRAIPKHHEGS